MVDIDFNPASVASTHSELTGVIAGFALAGVFLLIEQTRSPKSVTRKDELQKIYTKAILLLFVSFVTGIISSFLYSTITGDSTIKSFFLFQFPSAIFAVNVLVLLSGINMIFNAIETPSILHIARRVSYLIVCFSVATICTDIINYINKFNGGIQHQIVIILIAVIPILTVALLLYKLSADKRILIQERSFSPFCYSIIGASLFLGAIHTALRYIPEKQIVYQPWIPILLMSIVSALGAWTILISPKKKT